MNKPIKRSVNGVLLLDKAVGVSSNIALQQVRRLYRAQKGGHTGVLDPLAEGLLPLCFGEATKFARYLLDADKCYIATVFFGASTTTGDAEGAIVLDSQPVPTAETLRAAFTHFIGEIEQMPPMYSALKYQGRSLYEYARQGIEIERKIRVVTIRDIRLLSYQSPIATLEVSCSSGTYIRTLAEDIARFLGSAAHLRGLRRTQTAGFSVHKAYRYSDLQHKTEDQLDEILLPCDVLVAHLPEITIENHDVLALMQGKTIHNSLYDDTISPFRVYDKARKFVGLAQSCSGKDIKALRLMNTETARVNLSAELD